MSELRAGTVVRALDFSVTVKANDSTSLANVTSTTYTAGSPEVGTTFVAPTTGRVKLIVSGVGRDNGGGSDQRVKFSPQVYLGSDSSGTLVLSPQDRTAMSTMGEASNYHVHDRCSTLDGLDPGQTYYARVMYKVDGGSTADILYRGLIIVPLT